MNPGLRRWVSTPWIASLLCTSVFFAIFFGIFHPGYAINDDLKMIAIAAGYPANNPAPFLVFSNVLLGIVLVPLYSLHTTVNWEIWIFCTMNFFSVWAVLHILFSGSLPKRNKVLGVSLILASGAYFALNITFTSVAALSCFAGYCMLFSAAQSKTGKPKLQFAGGTVLILLGSVVRIEMLALVLPIFVLALVIQYRSINLKNLTIAIALAGTVVFTGYVFDRLYVRAHPDWHTYYTYNKAAQMLQDAHRLDNTGRQIRTIGWSGNDQELFARSFFPDADIYTLDRIQYLDNHVPGASQNILYTFRNFFVRLGSSWTILLLLAMIFIALWSLIGKPSKSTIAAVIGIAILCLVENLGLLWAYKDPYWVLNSTLAISAAFEILTLNWMYGNRGQQPPSSQIRSAAGYYAVILVTGLVAAMIMVQSIATSSDNLKKQEAYQGILADLHRLQLDGKMARDPVIISPAHGIPWEWSNPFVLGFPDVKFLDTGWSTFSPSYEEAMQNFGIQSLPEALYQRDNLYLMTETIFKGFLARYYEEHEKISVDFQTVYQMPNTYHFPLYDGLEIYKVVQSK